MKSTSRLRERLASTTKRPLFRRGIVLAGILVIALILPAFTLAPVTPEWVPAPLQLWAFDTRLLIGRPIVTFSSMKEAMANDTAVRTVSAGKRVTIQRDANMLAGTLFTPAASAPEGHPGILLLHGSTPQGRNLGLYRLLGQELAAAGYLVLTIDQRGYGQSSDPHDLNDPQSFDFVGDVQATLAWMQQRPELNGEELFLVGHSFGADVALTAAAADDVLLDKLVLIGPGRRFMTRGGTPEAPEFDYFRRREMRYMSLAQPIPADVFISYRTTLPIENHLDYLAQADHVPTLIIDGALESSADREFLGEVYAGMAGVKAYVTLAQADHYVNVANLGSLIVYDEDAVAELVSVLATFLDADT